MHKVERTGSQENEVSEQLELPAQVLKMSEIIFKKIDEESRGTIPIRCLPQALRLLDQAPTESDLKTIAANNKSDSNDGTGFTARLIDGYSKLSRTTKTENQKATKE
uniref:EF-hand domain-containing protein n=1 Tax=Mesocestoides corti TaxID=53468 RepID=A0A5K3FDT4_MESCO